MLRAYYVVPATCLGLVGLVAGVTVALRDHNTSERPLVAVEIPASSTSATLPTPAPEPVSSHPPSAASLPTAVPAPVQPERHTLPSVPRPGEPVAAGDAAGLARQLRDTARAIDNPSTSPRALARVAHLQQVAIRALITEPARRRATYALLDPRLRAAVESDVTAGVQLRSMIRRPKATLPPWQIVAPAPAPELLRHYRDAEREFGVPWQYLAAIHLVETRMGRIRGTSTAGAQGPMQFMPATWRSYGDGGDIHSNRDSIRAAARYLRASGAPSRIRKAVYAYNHDERYVDAVVLYADRMRVDARAYYGYHGWQVYYVTTVGGVWLPQGFGNG